ncbi:MAG: nucleotidyltransferase domain-containing protein [Candidatus Omnitrophica bacterium]|nr:nucleotidyltransferase domain-containing protein [Candidatus Omnitrophota bacterium]
MEKIFSTKQRIKILETVVFKKGNSSVNNIANQLRLSKGLVSKYFDILTKMGILKKVNGKLRITDSSLVKGIKILLNTKSIELNIFKRFPFVRSVGLYGSCAKGENTEDSDVDLWIKVTNVSEERLATLTSKLNKTTKNIKLLFLTDKKIEKAKKDDPLFYYSLVFGSIILYGGKDGIQI